MLIIYYVKVLHNSLCFSHSSARESEPWVSNNRDVLVAQSSEIALNKLMK